jgi:Tol biopolymer transport system component
VAAGEAPMVVEVAEMGAIGPFPPFTNPLAWSPDGRFLAVALPVAPLRTADLQVMDMSTGELRSLGLRSAGAFDLSWSPDGADLLVHVARPDGTAELHVAHVSTAASRALALPGAPGARLRVVRWVNGREIHVRHLDSAKPEVEDTFLINADTGRARKTCSGQAFNLDGAGGLPTAKGDICREITLDGTRQIVWNHGSKQLMIRDLATGMDRPLTTSSGEEYYGRLSPDDEIEVFVSNREGRWALYAARIDDAPVGRPTQLSVFDDVPTALNPIWTPDGFVAQLVRRESNVLRVDLDPATGKVLSEARRLTQDGSQNYTPMVSPDGQRIVYWSRQGSRFGLAVMDSNGANERIVAEVPEDYPGLRPSWRSPSEILVTTPPEGSSATFYLTAPAVTPRTVMSVSVSTGGALSVGELRDMPTISGQPQYLPKSGEAVYLDETYRVLRSLSLVNGSTRAVATFDGDLEVSSFMPSPDGARVAYSLARRYPNGRDCFERTGPPVERANDLRTASCELGVFDLATGERAILASTRTPQEVAAWSPDGRFLLYGAANGPRIMDTASPDYANWPLLEPGRQLNWENRTADWAPDGTFVVLTNSAQIWEWRQWSGVRSK